MSETASAPADPTFRVVAFQGPVTQKDPEANLERTLRALEWADARDAHVCCMPETFLQGYFERREDAWEHSIDLEGDEFAALCERVAPFRATLLLGLNERRGDDLYNTVVAIEGGRLVGRYSKNYLVYDYFRPGLEFPVFERDGVGFGVIICADSSYVEPSRILAMRGAQVIFSPHFNRINIEGVDHHTRRVRHHHVARAVENGVWIVRSNVIWPGDGRQLGLGDSFILDDLGYAVAEAGLLTETMLFHAIPRDRLGPTPRYWNRGGREIADLLRAEYARFENET